MPDRLQSGFQILSRIRTPIPTSDVHSWDVVFGNVEMW